MGLRFLSAAIGLLLVIPSGAPHGAADGPWPLGALVLKPGQPECLTGYTCAKFAITGCTGISKDAEGVLARASPPRSQSIRGLVVFFSGDEGKDWWSSPGSRAGRFLTRLRTRDGFVVVQVRWLDSWLKAPRGEDVGSAHLACRPSTAIDWIYQRIYLPLGISFEPGVCGFCVSGNSGGASQVAYALSHYGLDTILGAVFPTSGPPHAAQAKGCLPGWPSFAYEDGARGLIDFSSGFDDDHGDPGPCKLSDPGWVTRWDEESVDTGANDVAHPTTRVVFIIGADDASSAVSHAADYRDLLGSDPSNHVIWLEVQGMGHQIQSSLPGLAALEATLLGQ
jgi:hypothetical protein